MSTRHTAAYHIVTIRQYQQYAQYCHGNTSKHQIKRRCEEEAVGREQRRAGSVTYRHPYGENKLTVGLEDMLPIRGETGTPHIQSHLMSSQLGFCARVLSNNPKNREKSQFSLGPDRRPSARLSSVRRIARCSVPGG